VFLAERCAVSSVQSAVFRPWHNSTVHSATRLLRCRWYIIRSQPINSLFRCVKSLLLLW